MKKFFVLFVLMIGLLGAPVIHAQDTLTPTEPTPTDVAVIEVTPAATDTVTVPVVVNVNTGSTQPSVSNTTVDQIKELVGEAVNANNPALLAVIIALFVIVILLGSAFVFGAHTVFTKLPAYQQDAIRAAEPRISQELFDRLTALEKLTEVTPNPLDNYAVEWLKDNLPRLLKEIVTVDPVSPNGDTTVTAASTAKVTIEPQE